jgi:putative ABC transport system permease protein
MARILGLCEQLKLDKCPVQSAAAGDTVVEHGPKAGNKAARLELLSGASGMPNVVVFYPDEARGLGAKEIDDSFVGMHIKLAQQLLYGGGEKKISSIAVQLDKSANTPAAKARLNALIAEKKLPLEVRDLNEINPSFMQIIGYFQTMFAFLGLVLGIIVLFAVANTMGMSVMERTNEIGTARAMGIRRGGIRRLFLIEGAILGILGASSGILLSWIMSYWINSADITYTPPGNATPVPLYLMTQGNQALLTGVWIALVIISTIASIIPANRAAKMKVVDALRHV